MGKYGLSQQNRKCRCTCHEWKFNVSEFEWLIMEPLLARLQSRAWRFPRDFHARSLFNNNSKNWSNSSSMSPKLPSLLVCAPAGDSTQPKSLETAEDHRAALQMIGPSVLLPLQVNPLLSLQQHSTGTQPGAALFTSFFHRVFNNGTFLTKSNNKPPTKSLVKWWQHSLLIYL